MIEYATAKSSDLALVIDSWAASYAASYSAGIVQMRDWDRIMKPQIKKVLAREGVELLVARNPSASAAEVRADLHGWLCYERDFKHRTRVRRDGRWRDVWEKTDMPLVHYVYVKSAYRGMGIARGLFQAAEIDPIEPFYYTCKTKYVRELSRKSPGGVWNPLIARFQKDEGKAA